MSDDRLLLISPVRNEAAHIERVVAAMVAQTKQPDRWIVVDDGSTDDTLEILHRLEREVPFLEVVQAPPAPPRRDRLASAAAPRTFNIGLQRADWRAFDVIGKLDGDCEMEPSYYATMLEHFAQEPDLGICCGTLIEYRDGQPHPIHVAGDHVHGALKLYTRACFAAIGGVQERLGWDTIDQTYARLRGFRTMHYDAPTGIHHRLSGSADGVLRGRARHGECAYIAHFTLPWVTARAFKEALLPPFGVSGAAFLFGYLRAGARRTPRVDDPEFRRFARWELNQRIRRALRLPAGARPSPRLPATDA